MYVSKFSDSPPYSMDQLNKYYVSQHPCMSSISVCCMRDFKDDYVIGQLGNDITSTIGTCDSAIQNQQTLGMFDPANNQQYVDNMFLNYPNSSVHRVTNSQVQLLMLENDITDHFSTEQTLPSGGKKWTFFVGMSYFTLLPANAVSSSSSQTQITIQKTNSLTFSFASEQDYTFIQYITLSLYSNKWVDNLIERQMQFVKVGVVLPTGVQQNMATGLIPLGSIRFAVAQGLPEDTNEGAWTNPCLSSDNSGMWDISQSWRQQYSDASAQDCATPHNMCSNPITKMLASNLVEFYFPIGDGTIGPNQFNAAQRYNLYVYFDISIVDNNGIISTTKLFAQAPIGELSVNRQVFVSDGVAPACVGWHSPEGGAILSILQRVFKTLENRAQHRVSLSIV